MAYVKNPSTTKRKVVDTYKGYPIFKETTQYFRLAYCGLYDTSRVKDTNIYYGAATKGGNYSLSSDRYAYYCRSLEQAKGLIDRIEEGEIILTEKERYDWVLHPNSKNGWGFSKQMLLELIKQYKKATPRRRIGYLERLEDANFHYEYGLLEEGKFEELIEFIKESFNKDR